MHIARLSYGRGMIRILIGEVGRHDSIYHQGSVKADGIVVFGITGCSGSALTVARTQAVGRRIGKNSQLKA